ncbi:glycosyltransferase family 4 protein [Camelimonas abortus]|uniref:Glycosyltransferase family 4 protein n=1 Tax=Camelimonas abortus TaxID=1017184 RepID=A0ABV7LFA3_9HYPH
MTAPSRHSDPTPASQPRPGGEGEIAVVVKGYPRLSETFIAQEILALERRGLKLRIWSLREPTDPSVHPMHRQIQAPVTYLPEYLHEAPLRVLKGLGAALAQPGFLRLMATFFRDLRRDFTRNRVRRLGQAMVFARELPPQTAHVHVHYLHTPASVVRYAMLLRGGDRAWSFSAHAKDIWTTPEWEKREKIAECLFGVTCTRQNAEALRRLAPEPERIALAYHGLDLSRLPAPPQTRDGADGSDPARPVRIISVGRAVAKKGFGDLLQALAMLPPDIHWQFVHVGGGELLNRLRAEAQRLGLEGRVAFMGPLAQPEVMALMAMADMFVLPSRPTRSGDQDGLPNVIMEAASQKLAIVASDFAGIPEFIRDGVEGVLAPPADPAALANAINLLARAPQRRAQLGEAAWKRLREDFSMEAGISLIEAKLRAAMARNAGGG